MATTAEPPGRGERVKDAGAEVIVRLLHVIADHVYSVGLFGVSIGLHTLAPQVKGPHEAFNGFVDFVVYALFVLGSLRILKWAVLELAGKRQAGSL